MTPVLPSPFTPGNLRARCRERYLLVLTLYGQGATLKEITAATGYNRSRLGTILSGLRCWPIDPENRAKAAQIAAEESNPDAT